MGGVTVSLKVCQDCGAAYAPADVCPQCGGGVFRFSWEEEEMAKATVTGGGSNYAEAVPVEPEEDAPAPAPVKRGPGRPRKDDAARRLRRRNSARNWPRLRTATTTATTPANN